MSLLEDARKDADKLDIRLGQAVYNLAYDRNPAVARVAGTPIDPFHDDSRIDAFLAFIGDELPHENPPKASEMSSKSDRGTKRPKLVEERQPVGDLITHPCGCVEQKFDDESANITECPPHGLMTAATRMAEAGTKHIEAAQALGSVGQILLQDGVKSRAADANEAANAEVDKGIEDGEIS